MANNKNLASGTLVAGITTSSTTLTVYVGDGNSSTVQGVWPTAQFYATVMPSSPEAGVSNSLDSEIVLVTAVSSDQDNNTTLTVTRAQKNTTAKSFDAGAVVTNAIYTDEVAQASGTVGGPIVPVYLNNGVITAVNTQSSGNNYSIVPKVGSDGVMDIGRYIDLHNTASGATDYTTRIEANADGNLVIQGGVYPDVSVGNGISIRGANTKIGDLSSLDTSAKNNLVAAINEVVGVLDDVTYIGAAVGQATQLVDNEQNNIYPVAGSMINGSITTAMIQDGAITADKLDPDLSTYSTAEKAVGTWIDGSTVYEKSLSKAIATSDIPVTNEVSIETGTSNISVISVESVLNYTSTSDNKKRAIPLQRINPGNLSESYGLYYSEGSGAPSFRLQVPSTGRPQTTLNWHVIFRYIKD